MADLEKLMESLDFRRHGAASRNQTCISELEAPRPDAIGLRFRKTDVFPRIRTEVEIAPF
jgi:hypothetical protein